MPDDVEPPFRLKGLSLWIRGYQFPDATNSFDAGWLRTKVVLATSSFHLKTEGYFLQIADIARFTAQLEQLHSNLAGDALLESLEPNLRVELTGDGLGHIKMRVSLTPDHMTETHVVLFQLDQTYLPGAIAQLHAIAVQCPGRGHR